MENSEYTERIVTALKQLKNIHGPAALAYWVTPNTILTLSGVRAYCDGVFWSEDNNNLIQWVSEINKTCKTLSAIYDLVGCESGIEGAGQEKYASYEIITRPGLTYVLKNRLLPRRNPRLAPFFAA